MLYMLKDGNTVFDYDSLENNLCKIFSRISSKEIVQTIKESEDGVDLEKVDNDLILEHIYSHVDQSETKQEVIDELEDVLVLLSKVKSSNPSFSKAVNLIEKNIHKLQFDIFAI